MLGCVRSCAMDTIGERVKEAAQVVGGLNALAKIIEIPRRTVGDQISGKYEVKLSFIVAVARATGYSVAWLATGEGEKLGEPNDAAATIDAAVFRQVGRLVARVHQEEGVRLPPDAALDEQADAYNALITRAEDPADPAELEALLPWLEARLRKKLQTAAAEPGTGKRPA
ncbi:XRE family transcriptional regulator [Stappia sp. 28M-7]|uniref:XRE family transcriptional regulator n=1 Tax=Stappia sp. 28M-7 TaxID=2762596 RepID=UPI00163C7739|nr:XRE family transcriptional regulator [Stappia sp. 28M-7]MBC2858763.1 XRE family transcriptional regulator [Stappia sp. 28M-7]